MYMYFLHCLLHIACRHMGSINLVLVKHIVQLVFI